MDAVDDGPAAFAARLGHAFADPALLRQSLAHRSWCAEHAGVGSNERLEFLGDAVIGLAVADYGFLRYPCHPEGKLAKVRAAVVNSHSLAAVADGLGLGEVILLGKGEQTSGGRDKASILADGLEAVIGAVYLDAGWVAAQRIVLRLLGDQIDAFAADPGNFDHKSMLQELCARRGGQAPRYIVAGSGPDHERHFVADVFVDGERRGAGEGPSKKEAEQAAARSAWLAMRDA